MGRLQLLNHTEMESVSLEYLKSNGTLCYSYDYEGAVIDGYVLATNSNCYVGFYSTHRVFISPAARTLFHIVTTDIYGQERVSYSIPSIYRNGYYYGDVAFNNLTPLVESYSSLSDLLSASDYLFATYPITYRLTNCTGDGPVEAVVGRAVNVPLVFDSGYGVVNPATDAYVTNNGVVIPSTYENGVLSFTMPDPSK